MSYPSLIKCIMKSEKKHTSIINRLANYKSSLMPRQSRELASDINKKSFNVVHTSVKCIFSDGILNCMGIIIMSTIFLLLGYVLKILGNKLTCVVYALFVLLTLLRLSLGKIKHSLMILCLTLILPSHFSMRHVFKI